MCLYCENGSTWYDKEDDPLYAACLSYDVDGWHVDCFDSINFALSPPIEFCPKCGEKLPEGGRGF